MSLLAVFFAHPPAAKIFSVILWLAAAGHFCVLFASLQVPVRLRWKQDLAQLIPLNRKLMWVSGAFTVFTIISFGLLMFVLHHELLDGDRAALALALFIGVYWSLRVAVEFFYYHRRDWPAGRGMTAGRILLTLLFTYLAGSNLACFVWKVWLS